MDFCCFYWIMYDSVSRSFKTRSNSSLRRLA